MVQEGVFQFRFAVAEELVQKREEVVQRIGGGTKELAIGKTGEGHKGQVIEGVFFRRVKKF